MLHAQCINENLLTGGRQTFIDLAPVLRMNQRHRLGYGRRTPGAPEHACQTFAPVVAPALVVMFPYAKAGGVERYFQARVEMFIFCDTPLDFQLQPVTLTRQQIARLLECQLRRYARPQHGGTDGLADVVGCSFKKSRFLVLRAIQRGNEYDCDFTGRGAFAQLPEHGVAVHARHHDVQQNQVRTRFQIGQS